MFTGAVSWSAGYLAPEVLRDYRSRAAAEHLPRMPAMLADLLECCFQRDPEARPGNMVEIVTVLQEVYRQSAGRPYSRATPEPAQALADSLNNRAVSLLDLKNQDEAEQCWQEALAADPYHPESTFNLGLAQWRAGRLPGDGFVQKLQEVSASHPG